VVKPLDRLGAAERGVIEDRTATGYAVVALERYAGTEAVLRTVLERLLPGVPATIDLAAFVDTHAGQAMGRGDRRPGTPAEAELFAMGLQALTDAGFADRPEDDQRALIGRMRDGDADDELGMPAKDFIDRLLDKALAGYLAHPDTWLRIGFAGPAYPDGYAWIGPSEVIARHAEKRGWDRL
jgi:hypothetical protein